VAADVDRVFVNVVAVVDASYDRAAVAVAPDIL
jgi:hypothetical protein